MQGCVLACATETVLLTINGILKNEKKIRGIPKNSGEKIADFHKTLNERFVDFC